MAVVCFQVTWEAAAGRTLGLTRPMPPGSCLNACGVSLMAGTACKSVGMIKQVVDRSEIAMRTARSIMAGNCSGATSIWQTNVGRKQGPVPLLPVGVNGYHFGQSLENPVT